MRFIVREIFLAPDEPEELLLKRASARLDVLPEVVAGIETLRRSTDARRGEARFSYTLAVDIASPGVSEILKKRGQTVYEEPRPRELIPGDTPLRGRPVVVGAGPCGLLAALTLAEHGYAPLLLERGKPVRQRSADFSLLCERGVLNPESNALFGEGGAGAFSDGKLTTRIKDPRARDVLRAMVAAGAPEEILYLAKPHLGTDRICEVVRRLRLRAEELGAETLFGARLTRLLTENGALRGVEYQQNGAVTTLEASCVVLACGHSARDVYELLAQTGVAMEQKPFAVGVRVEHRREFIDKRQYGALAGHPRLGAAEYALTANCGGRGVYTFCMCPGGLVVCSASEEGGVAVNGMSYSARDGENSNSAVVVSVTPEDFARYGAGPLAGVELQRELERAAFELAGGYGAPAQRLVDFYAGHKTRSFGVVQPTYKPYVVKEDLNRALPAYLAASLKAGFARFGRAFAGFDMPDAVLTGFETRTSAPVRILRGADGASLSLSGLYPAGEGAGCAGGIISAAADGIRAAEHIIERYKYE